METKDKIAQLSPELKLFLHFVRNLLFSLKIIGFFKGSYYPWMKNYTGKQTITIHNFVLHVFVQIVKGSVFFIYALNVNAVYTVDMVQKRDVILQIGMFTHKQ